jgi:hypothetical protein
MLTALFRYLYNTLIVGEDQEEYLGVPLPKPQPVQRTHNRDKNHDKRR